MFPYRIFFLSVVISLLAIGDCWAQAGTDKLPVPDPEEERKTFVLPDGFEVNLFAADPEIAKPIQMNFDPQGRLWVVSSEVYPHIKPGQKANDRVLVLTDVDGDGVSDRTTVFADGLLIPTGVAPGDGGVYVANSTELLHFRDTDGDGRADKQRTVLSGFGTEDTHHILHTLRWGPEGFLYFNQSIYIHSHIETPYGVRRLNGGGIWQFRPETMQLEVYLRGLVNTWGHDLDKWGQSFATDGAGTEGINFVIPGAYYSTAVGASKIIRGLNPGSPKHCGLEMVSGRHFPQDWEGNFIANDFRGHRVCRFVVTDQGSGFVSREGQELIRSDHVAFRPVDVKMGPDGAIYIADWYNPIIQHGEVDFRDSRRDHTHGRIWRVSYKNRPLVDRPELVSATTQQLLEQLKSPEGWTRTNAKRVLKERGPVIAADVDNWVSQLDSSDPRLEHWQLEALWTFQAIDVPRPALLATILKTEDFRARAAATRVIHHWKAALSNPLQQLAEQVKDSHPRVRLEAIRSLSHFPQANAAAIALNALDNDVDSNIDYALWLTLRELQSAWLPQVQSGAETFGGDVAKLTYALKTVDSGSAVGVMVQLLRDQKIAAEGKMAALEFVSSAGNPAELGYVLNEILTGNQSPEQKAQLLTRLVNESTSRNVRPQGTLSDLSKLLETQSQGAGLQRAAVNAIGSWKVAELQDRLKQFAADGDANEQLRIAAIDGLAQINSSTYQELFQTIGNSPAPESVRAAAVAALVSTGTDESLQQALPIVSQLTDDAALTTVFQSILSRKTGPAQFAAALSEKTIPAEVARVGLRVISSSGQKADGLVAALTTAGKITGGPKQLTPEEMKAMVTAVQTTGDATRGEAVYRRAELNCLKCHAIGGAGGKVGPDMVSLGGSAQVDYLIESLLDPNKKVKENFNTIIIETEEGKVISGIKVRQSDTDLILRDAEGREISIRLENIEEQANGASIMPTGLIDRLTKTELVDLVRFLSELGRTPAFTVNKQTPVVRTWQVLNPTPDAIHRIKRTSYATAAGDDPAFRWSSAYSNVNGALPLKDLPGMIARHQVDRNSPGVTFLRFELQASEKGAAQLQFNDVKGLSLWVGIQPVGVEKVTAIELNKGRNNITLVVDRTERKDDLQVTLKQPTDGPHVEIVVGK